jgi:hyperosmotically inducible protein
MRSSQRWPVVIVIAAMAWLAGCSRTNQAPDVANNIRQSLDSSGFKKVSVSQDRDKGVVTLSGQVASEDEKGRAAALANSLANGQVVANQIGVVPSGEESSARAINSDLDKGIEQNLDAALIQNKLHDHVKFSVKNHVVTLTGEVDSQGRRREAEAIAASIPNVQQVVNELQVKNQKATSSE